MIMPAVGDMLCENLFRVEYINYGKFWFSASYKTVVPTKGHIIKLDDRNFVIDQIDVVKKRFSAAFKGFDQPDVPVPDAPEVEVDQDLVKLI